MAVAEENPQTAKEFTAVVCYLCTKQLIGGEQIAVSYGWKVHSACLPKRSKGVRYRANPIEVEAFEIVSVSPETGNGNMQIITEDEKVRQADAPMLARYSPTPGDFWVIQSDGYEYVNPREVFLRKYSLIPETCAEGHAI